MGESGLEAISKVARSLFAKCGKTWQRGIWAQVVHLAKDRVAVNIPFCISSTIAEGEHEAMTPLTRL